MRSVMSDGQVEGLKKALKTARKREVAFALSLNKDPDLTVLLASPKLQPKVLMLEALKTQKNQRRAQGMARVEGKALHLRCEGDSPGNIGKALAMFLKVTLGTRLDVTVVDEFGDVSEGGAPEAPAPDRHALEWERIAPKLARLYQKAMSHAFEGREKVEAAHRKALSAAEAGDHRTALAIVKRIQPHLAAAAKAET